MKTIELLEDCEMSASRPWTHGPQKGGGWLAPPRPDDEWNVITTDVRAARAQLWLSERIAHAITLLRESVVIDAEVRSGVPVLRGTRISVARILAEIADDQSISQIADNLELNVDDVKNLIEGISINLDRPFTQ